MAKARNLSRLLIIIIVIILISILYYFYLPYSYFSTISHFADVAECSLGLKPCDEGYFCNVNKCLPIAPKPTNNVNSS
jgi:hypothetical protein